MERGLQVDAYLSLGSNLGDRLLFLQQAIKEISQHTELIAVSSIYETPPWGFESEASFYNCCIHVTTTMSPYSFLDLCKTIEQSLGQPKKNRDNGYASRKIDIDIIFFGAIKHQSEELTLPHEHYYKRNFVLYPLNEIAANIIDPITHLSVSQRLSFSMDTSPIKKTSEKINIKQLLS